MTSAPRSRRSTVLARAAVAALALAWAAAAPAGAAPPDPAGPPGGGEVAAGARVGTTGLGAEVAFWTGERTQVRLVASGYSFGTTISTRDVDYHADARVGVGWALLDWYPAGGAFRVSAGGGWNGTEAQVSAPLEDLIRVERPDLPVIPVDVGTAAGTAKGNDFVPVVLLGWGNPFRGGPWSVSFEIGAYYQGSPSVDLHVRTSLPVDQIPGGQAALDALIADQERELEDKLHDYQVLPLVSLAISYRF